MQSNRFVAIRHIRMTTKRLLYAKHYMLGWKQGFLLLVEWSQGSIS
jgi:hypothetical protein